MKIAFSMYPTSLEDLMAIADAGEVMPPRREQAKTRPHRNAAAVSHNIVSTGLSLSSVL